MGHKNNEIKIWQLGLFTNWAVKFYGKGKFN